MLGCVLALAVAQGVASAATATFDSSLSETPDKLGRNAMVAITLLENGNLQLVLTNTTPANVVAGHDWALTGISFTGLAIENFSIVSQSAALTGDVDKSDKKTIVVSDNTGLDGKPIVPMLWTISHENNEPYSLNFISSEYGMAIISKAALSGQPEDHLWYLNGQHGSVTNLNPYAYVSATFELEYQLEDGFSLSDIQNVIFYFENGIKPTVTGYLTTDDTVSTPEPASLALLGLGAAGLLAKRRRSR